LVREVVVWDLLAQLTPEPSLYDSYILSTRADVLWYFLCFALGGLAGALFLRKPEKEDA
jgi:hypothetical protein